MSYLRRHFVVLYYLMVATEMFYLELRNGGGTEGVGNSMGLMYCFNTLCIAPYHQLAVPPQQLLP
jgi:hypothetical protein